MKTNKEKIARNHLILAIVMAIVAIVLFGAHAFQNKTDPAETQPIIQTSGE